MAKSSSGSKSQAIRDYLSAHRGAGPKEVVEKLGEQGVKVSTQLVSVVKSKMKSRGKKRRVVRKPQQATPAASSSSNGLSIGDLVETKKLVDQLGGVKQARAALDALERLR
ncbi:MAG: hypothetical protein WD069_12815 [Planctomycetales bacterium]